MVRRERERWNQNIVEIRSFNFLKRKRFVSFCFLSRCNKTEKLDFLSVSKLLMRKWDIIMKASPLFFRESRSDRIFCLFAFCFVFGGYFLSFLFLLSSCEIVWFHTFEILWSFTISLPMRNEYIIFVFFLNTDCHILWNIQVLVFPRLSMDYTKQLRCIDAWTDWANHLFVFNQICEWPLRNGKSYRCLTRKRDVEMISPEFSCQNHQKTSSHPIFNRLIPISWIIFSRKNWEGRKEMEREKRLSKKKSYRYRTWTVEMRR